MHSPQFSLAQQQYLISTANGTASLNNGQHVDWVLGETITETIGTTQPLTQGFFTTDSLQDIYGQNRIKSMHP